MNKNFFSILAVMVTFIITGVVIVVTVIYFQPHTVTAKSVESASHADENALISNIAVPTNTPAEKVKYPLKQQVKGIKMEVRGTASEGEYFTVNVCYNLPEQKSNFELALGGPNPNFITLSTKNETIPLYGWKITSEFDEDSSGKVNGRCASLFFPVSPDTNLDKLRLSISRMSTPMAESLDCVKAQLKLDNAKQKIKVKCGSNGHGFSIVEKAAELDDATAKSIAADAFIDIVEGPWLFDLN